MMFTNIEQTSSFYLTQAATLSSLKILSTKAKVLFLGEQKGSATLKSFPTH